MKYLVIGAGGTGGSIAAFLALAGLDVTVIARGRHLENIKENGLVMHSPIKGDFSVKVKACTAEACDCMPDVIFVCVKGYSLDEAGEIIERLANGKTVIIPILNIYGTGSELKKRMPQLHILEGCIYISAYISAPGEITQVSQLFRIIYGETDGVNGQLLYEIADELNSCGIKTVVSDDIKRSCLMKYAFISAFAATGAYYNACAGDIAKNEEMRKTFVSLSNEIGLLANVMGIQFETDIVEKNLEILDASDGSMTSSMHKDILKGGNSEVDGLVFVPVRLGKEFNIPTPQYKKIADFFQFKQ